MTMSRPIEFHYNYGENEVTFDLNLKEDNPEDTCESDPKDDESPAAAAAAAILDQPTPAASVTGRPMNQQEVSTTSAPDRRNSTQNKALAVSTIGAVVTFVGVPLVTVPTPRSAAAVSSGIACFACGGLALFFGLLTFYKVSTRHVHEE